MAEVPGAGISFGILFLPTHNRTTISWANLTFALSVKGEHQIRPYGQTPFDCAPVLQPFFHFPQLTSKKYIIFK